MQPIVIELDKTSYVADDTVKAKIMLRLSEPINSNGIYATIYCYEKRKIEKYAPIPPDEILRMKELGIPIATHVKKIEETTEGNVHSEERKIAGKGRYFNQTFEVEFKLPKNAAPTSYALGHDNKISIWRIKVKIDIPFALDISAEKDVFVAGL